MFVIKYAKDRIRVQQVAADRWVVMIFRGSSRWRPLLHRFLSRVVRADGPVLGAEVHSVALVRQRVVARPAAPLLQVQKPEQCRALRGSRCREIFPLTP